MCPMIYHRTGDGWRTLNHPSNMTVVYADRIFCIVFLCNTRRPLRKMKNCPGNQKRPTVQQRDCGIFFPIMLPSNFSHPISKMRLGKALSAPCLFDTALPSILSLHMISEKKIITPWSQCSSRDPAAGPISASSLKAALDWWQKKKIILPLKNAFQDE